MLLAQSCSWARPGQPRGSTLPLSSRRVVCSELREALVVPAPPRRRCISVGGPTTTSCPRAGVRWGALSPFTACRGTEVERCCNLDSQQLCATSCSRKGGCETPDWEEAASLSSSLGSTRVRALAHWRPAASAGQAGPVLAGCLTGFAHVLRSCTKYELPNGGSGAWG